MTVVVINKVREEWGALGNMAPYKILYKAQYWPRSEHLFQALRFKEEAFDLREQIREEPNPMKAKMIAKRLFKENPDKHTNDFCTMADVIRMVGVLRLKLHQHEEIQKLLLLTGERDIVEDATRRQRGSGLFWGAALQEDGTWKGENWLGRLWVELRQELISGTAFVLEDA